ncbi:MAG TPA: hypothetical protein VF046_05795 [Gemmatimonadales bacterium]
MSPALPLVVVKVGGGISAYPGALDSVCAALAAAGDRHRLLLVPGGGPFADAVRAFDERHELSADAAHWMAILAMDQYAHVLAERIPGARMIDAPETAAASANAPGVAVLAPYRWLRAADVLPHTWRATSDSVAAFVAGALDADCLVLIKPVGRPAEALVDPCFESVLPVGLRWEVLGWDEADRLEALLTPS